MYVSIGNFLIKLFFLHLQIKIKAANNIKVIDGVLSVSKNICNDGFD